MSNYIFDAKLAGRSPQRRHPVTGLIEKLPFSVRAADSRGRPMRRYVLMCDADGVIARPVLSTGASEPSPKNKYGDVMREKFASNGWFEYGRCPLTQIAADAVKAKFFAHETLAIPIDGSCSSATDDTPCAHAVAEAARRKDRKRSDEERIGAAWKSEAAKLAEQAAAGNAKLLESLGAMAEAVTRSVPVKPTKRGIDE